MDLTLLFELVSLVRLPALVALSFFPAALGLSVATSSSPAALASFHLAVQLISLLVHRWALHLAGRWVLKGEFLAVVPEGTSALAVEALPPR
jgi:hypothetical protein